MTGLVFILLTGVAVLAVLVPLARRREGRVAAGEAAVYRDQLAEIDRDLARGAIGGSEAEAARVEVARRLIAISEKAPENAQSSTARRRMVAVLALVALPLLAGGIYLSLGRPDLSDRPLAERRIEDESLVALISRVESELARRPDDGQGWDVLAPVYLRAGQPGKAAEAYANAIRLLGATAAREAGRGESLVIAAQGKVSPEAKAAFERAVALDPKDARSRFYLGGAAEQAGDREAAADIYRRLLAEAGTDAAYVPMVREALARTALGDDGKAPAVDPAALEGVNPDQRLATIRGMVEGLEARLKNAPQDAGGQLRLIRAWAMLGEADKAKAAAANARTVFASDDKILRRISDLLIGLGLEEKPA